MPNDRPPDNRRDRLGVILAGGAAILAICALITSIFGHLRLDAGSIRLSVSGPGRPVSQSLALLLLCVATRAVTTRRSRAALLGIYAALLAALSWDSPLRLVGDGHEYVVMAWNLSRGRLPSPTDQDLLDARGAMPPGTRIDRLPWPPVRADGRRDFCHSWGYSALAAPLVAAARAVGAPPLVAFTFLNGLILLVTATCLLERDGRWVFLLLLGGPILWWLDKAHPEPFVMGLLVASMASLPRSPGRALSLLGLVGLQYPVFLAPAAAAVVWLAARGHFRRPGARAGLAALVTLSSVGLVYNVWRFGRLTPLAATVLVHLPSISELTAVLVDPNLGLAFAWPSLALASLLALVSTLWGRRLETDTALFLSLCAAFLAVVVAMTANANHGGTRDLSRYGLWFVPLTVPILLGLEAGNVGGRRALFVLAAASLATGLGGFRPALASRYLEPTPFARSIWQRWPALDDPLPEVFAERTSGREGRNLLPTATEGCEKALIVGDATARSVWPLSCRPQELPPRCRPVGVYCYANRLDHTSFARAPRQAAWDGLRPSAWYWSGTPTEPLVRLVTAAARDATHDVESRSLSRLIPSAHRTGPLKARAGETFLMVWVERPRRDGWIELAPGPARRAVAVDPRQGELLAVKTLGARLPAAIPLPLVRPLLLVVAPEALVPPELGSPGDAEMSVTSSAQTPSRETGRHPSDSHGEGRPMSAPGTVFG